ncbi:MAG: AEC family transporter [Acutalibacteraceae bacterium]
MTENFLTVAQQVLILFILIAVGYVCGKVRFLTPVTSKNLTNIVLYFVTPCVVIDAFQREFNAEMFLNLGVTTLCALGIHLISILIVTLVFRDKDKSAVCVLRFGTVFSNCGFMSIPLQSALLGSDGVFYGAAFVAVFNLVLWSYGLVCMGGSAKSITPKKLILNPGVIGVAVGFLLFVFSVQLPEVIGAPVSYLAALNTPLPMIIIGFYLSNTDIIKALKNKRQYIAIALRLVVIPLLSLFVMWLCGVRGVVLVACVIAASAPVAAATTMFAAKFDRNTSLSVNLVSISTILSIITMPLVVGFAQVLA